MSDDKNGTNEREDSPSRIRTTSECSYTSDDGASGYTGGRR